MADALRIFNDDDMNELQRLVRASKEGRISYTRRSGYTDSMSDFDSPQSAEMYVAKPSTSAGIPALYDGDGGTGSGTGTASSPGYGDCDIYQVLYDEEGVPYLSLTALQQEVLNINATALDQTWMLVSRDKYGRWFANVSSGVSIVRGVISELGDYDVHLVTLLSDTFSENLGTDSIGRTRTEVDAYVASELDYKFNVGDVVRMATINGQYWIIDAKQNCEGYCISDYNGVNQYAYGWSFLAPNLPCCPEAGGVHLLTTSDSGTTYTSSTFQCNSDGTDRQWIFKSDSLRISPMLPYGNIQYKTDNAPELCTVRLQRYEWGRFPSREDCGSIPKSVCLNPMCGVGTCANCTGGLTPMTWIVTVTGAMTDNPDNASSNPSCSDVPVQYVLRRGVSCPSDAACMPHTSFCGWSDEDWSRGLSALLTVNSSFVAFQVDVDGDNLRWEYGTAASCNDKISLDYDYSAYGTAPASQPCSGFPLQITAEPILDTTLEGNCYPTSNSAMEGVSGIHCSSLPFLLEVEFSGVTDNTCNSCNQFNDIFAMELTSTYRNWNGTQITFTCPEISFGKWRVRWPLPISAGTDEIVLQFREGLGFSETTIVEYTGPLIADWNCYGPNEFTYSSDNGECSNWPATVTVYPLLGTA